MNIDNNTIVFVGLSCVAAFFAYKFLQQRVNNRESEMYRQIAESRESMWREIDDVRKEVENLNRRVDCCCKRNNSTCNQGSVSY